MRSKSIVGDLINFRGLVYSPLNENGVIFLFGKVIEDLNMYIEEIKPGFPDCLGRRFTGRGWELVSIEFEYKSSNFKDHKHDPSKCDLIVCWEHDWPECPLEVIELKETIKTLPDKPIKRPDILTEEGRPTLEDHLSKYPDKIRKLFNQFDEKVKAISEEIWHKVTTEPGVTYYSPKRVFIYLNFQKQAIRLFIFTRGEKLKGVESFEHQKGGDKWGRIYIRDNRDLNDVLLIVKRSYELIIEAIKNNEPTGWYAELEDDCEKS
ncbi:hypothetical protein ACFLT2_03310 [Acidobacteriota bacterium]